MTKRTKRNLLTTSIAYINTVVIPVSKK